MRVSINGASWHQWFSLQTVMLFGIADLCSCMWTSIVEVSADLFRDMVYIDPTRHICRFSLQPGGFSCLSAWWQPWMPRPWSWWIATMFWATSRCHNGDPPLDMEICRGEQDGTHWTGTTNVYKCGFQRSNGSMFGEGFKTWWEAWFADGEACTLTIWRTLCTGSGLMAGWAQGTSSWNNRIFTNWFKRKGRG